MLTWVVTSYTLCFGGLLLFGGRLADVMGRRRTFLLGLGVFTVASVASGLAPSGSVLIVARAWQGAGAALISPSALALVTTMFEGGERTRALGIWAAAAGAGVAIGVLVSGALVEYATWRSVFFINVPVAAAVAGSTIALVAHQQPTSAARRLDGLGAVTGTLAMAAIILGLVTAGDHGLNAPETLVPLIAGLVLAAAFVAVERHAPAPLLPLWLLTRRSLVAGQITMLLGTGLLLAVFFLSSLYLQRVLGSLCSRPAWCSSPPALATIAGSHFGARAIVHVGPRPVGMAGFLMATAGMILLARVPVRDAAVIDVVPGLLVVTAGLGATIVTASTSAMADIGHGLAGAASGVLSTGHELGASIGIAAVSTVAGRSLAATAGDTAAALGFTGAFAAGAAAALTAAVVAPLLLPRGRLPISGAAIAH